MLSPALITLIGSSMAMVANTITLLLIVCIFYLKKSILSAHFAINLHTWFIAVLLDLFYLGYITMFWRGEDTIYSMTIMFWSGTLCYACMFSSSSSVFFLTCDRCLILTMPATYTQAKRRQLAAVNIGCQVLGYIGMILWLLPEAPPVGIYKACMTIGCAGGSYFAIKVTNMKLFFFVLNLTSGFIFAILLIRFNKRRSLASSNVKSANTLASYSIFTELLCNFFPNLIGNITFNWYGILLSTLIGPYMSYAFSIEGLLMSLAYSRVLNLKWKLLKDRWIGTEIYVIGNTSGKQHSVPNTVKHDY